MASSVISALKNVETGSIYSSTSVDITYVYNPTLGIATIHAQIKATAISGGGMSADLPAKLYPRQSEDFALNRGGYMGVRTTGSVNVQSTNTWDGVSGTYFTV